MAGTRQRGKLWRVKLISLAVASCFAREAAFANPTGPVVVNGQVTFHQQGNLLQVTNSPGSIINWQSFSIGANEITRFLQQAPSSAVLNRVVTQNPSAILGALQSNGRVFLINPNGILFGAGAQIDVAGLVASTLRMSDADFLAGRMRFTEVAGAGSVINQGAINTAQGGQVYLVGPAVTNQGIITSPKGEVILAAGNRVELVDPGTPNLRVEITAPDNQAVNLGTIAADAGRVGIHAGLINHSGTIRADSAVVTADGRIVLKATKSVALETGSLTSASGAKGGEVAIEAPLVIQAGDVRADGATGGSVSVQAENFLQSAALSADGTQGAGGSVSVRADRIIQTESAVLSASGNGGIGGTVNVAAGQEEGGRIFSSATFSATGDTGGEITVTGNDVVLRAAALDASGENAGGTILVGGDWQGGNPDVPNSRSAHVNFSTTLRADARQRGDGGKVVVWSDEDTQFFGSVSARGGAEAGDGGRIEVSGKENLVFGGHADAGAPNGRAGTLLLDPKNITIDASAGPSATDLVDPNIGESDQFGTGAVVLANGNIVAPDSNDSFAATNAGAVYFFDGTTGALLSALTGTNEFDQVGVGGITPLTNGNFVVSSPNWNNGSVERAGAATWGSGSTGVSGAVSAANSLAGMRTDDQVSNFGVTVLTNGNYVVNSSNWSNGIATNVGAVTWGNGLTGVTGLVSSANSLVGSTTADQVGIGGVTALTNGNYVVSSNLWNRGAIADAGAVTWGSGTAGVTGAVSTTNSFVGSNANDQIGMNGAFALANGNYVVSSSNWNGERGAVTWRNGTTATTGTVSSANSLVGSTPRDFVGTGGVTALANGNYVVSSYFWNNGAANAGAVTWGNGTTGAVGTVSASNSLVGTSAGDMVGILGVTALTNGNYVVSSPEWNNGAATRAGAVTWGSGTVGVTGPVSGANSLVGITKDDQVGSSGVAALANGNYVVSSPFWTNGAATSAGAVTWGGGTSGATGAVSSVNSLVGTSEGDLVGWYMATALTNGNYVVSSPFWSNGAASSAGAVTWGNGTTGVNGAVTTVNSLAGTIASDQVGFGGVVALSNGNYVVSSPNWNSGRGAVTWGNGTLGATGTVSTVNSLVGTIVGDQVGGFFALTALSNGNYVVSSPDWNLGQGAVTWGNGAAGVTGAVSSANSLTGASAGDQLGREITELSGNRVLVGSPFFDNGAVDSGRLQIYDGSGGGLTNPLAFSDSPSGNVTITPSTITAITNTGTAVTLQANNDVTLNSDIASNNPSGNGGALTLQAGRSILLNADITTDNGNLTLVANESAANGVVDAHRDPGNAVIAMAPGTAIDTGTGNLSITLGTGAGLTHTASAAITLQSLNGNAINITNSGSTPGGGIALNGPVNAGGEFTATTTNGGIALNANLSAGGAVNFFGSGSGVTLDGNIVTAGAGVTIFNNVVLGAAPTVLIDTTNGGAVPAGRSIVVQGTVNDDAGSTHLTLRAGTSGVVSLIGDVGGTTPIDGLSVISANVARLPNVRTREGGISVATIGSAKLLGNLDTTQGLTGAGNVTFSGPVELVNDVQITTNHASGPDGHVSFVGTGTTINTDNTDPFSPLRALTINAGGGDVTFGGVVGGVKPLESLTASGQSISLNGGAVNGAVILDAGTSGSISFGNSLLAGSLSATAGGGIADSSGTALDVIGNANFSGGNIELGENPLDTTHFGSLTFNSTGTVSISEDSATVLAGNNTANNLTLTSAGAISDAAGASLTVTSDASFTGTSIMLADNTGDVLSVGGNASFNSAGGGITLGTAGTVNFGSLTINSTDAVNITEDSAMVLIGTNTAGNLTLTSNGGSITLAAGTVTANALELSAETGISLSALAVTSVQATNSTSGDVSLSDMGGLSITGISNTGGTISVTTTGDLTVDGNVTSGTFSTSLAATGGSISQSGGTVTASALALAAENGITLDSLAVDSVNATNSNGNVTLVDVGGLSVTGVSNPNGEISVATTGNLSLDGNVTSGANATVLSAIGGAINQTAGSLVAGALDLSAATGITLGDLAVASVQATNSTSGDVTLSDTGGLSITGISNVGGAISVLTTGGLSVDGNVDSGTNAASLAATGGSITHAAGALTAGTLALTSSGGSIGQTGGSITAGSAVLAADTGISLTAGSIAMLEATNNVSGDISVTGMSGPLTASAGGIDNAAAAGNVTLATTGALTLAGDVTVQPGQSISLSGGTIGSTGGSPVADTLLLSSVNGATLGNVVANRLSAVNTGTGNVNLSVQNDVEIFGAGLVNAGGDAVLTAAGDLALGANVNATGAATLAAAGSIVQTNGTVSANTVVLTSANGSIGTGTSGRVNTQADTLAATANNGGVFISEFDSVNLAGGSAGGGGFDLVAGGALAVNGNVTSMGALNLASIGFSNNAIISGAGGISIDAGGGAFTNNAGGVIAGSGTLDATGTTFTNDGTLRPGGAGAVGTLTVIGDAAFNGGGTIEIEALGAGSGQYDVTAVTGNAGLGGTLSVINMGGYVPANGDVLVPVTFASGAGAFIIVPASVFAAAYNANNLTLTVGEVIDLINRWIGTTGNWAVASNWSLGHIPTLDETVVIDVPGLQTITVSSGQLGAFKLTSQENFQITGGQLALGGPSTFDANLTITGGGLTGSGNVVVNGNFNWTGGKLVGPGTFTTTGISTLSPRWRDLELRRDWINLGTIDWRGTNGRDLYILGNATLLNAAGGTLNLLGSWGSDIKGDGELVNEGTLNKKGNQTTTIKAEFSNSGTLRVKDGELQLKNSDGNDGAIEISKHATLDVNGPGYANRGVISGTGTLDVKDTRFVNEGTVAPGSSGGAGIGTLTIAGNYRQSASGTLLMDAAGKKSGRYDRLEVTGKATLDGTLTVNAVGGYVPRKGDTLELITYKSRSGTFTKLDGPDGYSLRADYDRRSAKFKLKPE